MIDTKIALIPCCDNPDLQDNDGSMLGFMVIRCMNCNMQSAGKTLKEFQIQWDRTVGIYKKFKKEGRRK